MLEFGDGVEKLILLRVSNTEPIVGFSRARIFLQDGLEKFESLIRLPGVLKYRGQSKLGRLVIGPELDCGSQFRDSLANVSGNLQPQSQVVVRLGKAGIDFNRTPKRRQ